MSPRKSSTPRAIAARERARRARAADPAPPGSPADLHAAPVELVHVSADMGSASLGTSPDPAPAAPDLGPEGEARAALEDPAPGEPGGAPLEPRVTGAELLAAAETATGIVVASSAELHKVPETERARLDELSHLTRTERAMLTIVADDAALVLGAGRMPPKVAACVFVGLLLFYGFQRQRAVRALAPPSAKARADHASTWGKAADAVPTGTYPKRSGFPPPYTPQGEAPIAG